MLNRVLPMLRLARNKSTGLFLGQIVRLSHCEITLKISKCATWCNWISYDT